MNTKSTVSTVTPNHPGHAEGLTSAGGSPRPSQQTRNEFARCRGRATKCYGEAVKAKRLKTMNRKDQTEDWFRTATEGRLLKFCIDRLACKGVHTLRAMANVQRWAMANQITEIVRTGTYRPGRVRRRLIPKANGGCRTLSIPTMTDRIIGRAILQVAQTILESQFLESSFGFRKGKGRMHALCAAERMAITENRWVWIKADIRDAFDNIPVDRLTDLVKKYFPQQKFADLLSLVGTPRKKKGIYQGAPLSPLLANLYFHHHLDRRWSEECGSIPMIRYADDLLLLCHDHQEADKALETLSRFIQDCGLQLKNPKQKKSHDLCCGEIHWLGFTISKEQQSIRISISDVQWASLKESLSDCFNYPNISERAEQVVSGWLQQLVPAYIHADRNSFLQILQSILQCYYLEELDSTVLMDNWRLASDRYQTMRGQCVNSHTARGFANAEPQRITNDPSPGEDSARESSPGSSSLTHYLITAGECLEPGGPGRWGYRVYGSDEKLIHHLTGESKKTSLHRMQLLALDRALERFSNMELAVPMPEWFFDSLHSNVLNQQPPKCLNPRDHGLWTRVIDRIKNERKLEMVRSTAENVESDRQLLFSGGTGESPIDVG
jgi:group II intron reverse transcriptase/maturase